MITVDRTMSHKDIKSVIFHPEVIRLSTESGEKSEVDVLGTCWVGSYVDGKIVGVFAFKPLNKVSLDAHCYFLPKYRKEVSAESYNKSVEWVFSNSTYEKLIVKCNQKDWHVKNFCLKSGFRLEGRLEKSAVINKVLVDEYILGMTKGQFLEYTNV